MSSHLSADLRWTPSPPILCTSQLLFSASRVKILAHGVLAVCVKTGHLTAVVMVLPSDSFWTLRMFDRIRPTACVCQKRQACRQELVECASVQGVFWANWA